MRVGNSPVNFGTADVFTRTSTKNAQNVGTSGDTGKPGSDRSSLSNTGELVGLAKNLVPADRSSRLQAIQAAVNGGQYEADPVAVGQALVNEHLKS
jgi:anti-sigma28 factor (negative regulator of flagellin synthesis)